MQHFCDSQGVKFFAVTKFCETGLEHLPETLRTELRREKFVRTRILLTANLCTVNAFANNFSSLVKQHIRRSSIIWCIYMLCKNKMGSYIICHFLTLHVCSSKKNLNSKHSKESILEGFLILWCVYLYPNSNPKLVTAWIFNKMKLIPSKNKWANFFIRRTDLFFVKKFLHYIYTFCCLKDAKSVFNK